MKKVSIIIPCRNEEKYIQKCIASILQQDYDIDKIEIVVVDGMSEDKTRDVVTEIKQSSNRNIKLIENIKKITPYALNLGIKGSSGDVVIILGAHSYIDKDFVKNNVRNLYDKNYECSGGVIETINENFMGQVISSAMSCPFGVGNALFRYSTKEQEVDTVPFAAYKREVFDKIGYFDEQLVRNQDDEFNLRLSNSGGKVLLSPDIKSYYYSRSSMKKLWKQYFQYGFWKVRVIQKHNKPASIRHLIPLLFVVSLVAGTVLSFFSKIIGGLFLLEIALYLLISLVFAFKIGKGIKQKVIMPLVFFILHFSYGTGFLMGIFNFYIKQSKKILESNTEISR